MCRVEGVEGCPTSNFDPESIENIKLDFSQFQKYILKLWNNKLHFFFIKSQLIEKLTVNRVIKPSIVLIDKAFKGRLVVPDFHSFKNDISDIFSRSATWQTQIRNRLPKVRVWKRRNDVETRPTPKPGKLGGCNLHDWRTKVFQFVCMYMSQ